MAASKLSTQPNTNIPDYEYTDVNSKPFHIGSFRNEWLSRLNPSDFSYQQEDEDTFDANFAEEMGVGAEIMSELKTICRWREANVWHKDTTTVKLSRKLMLKPLVKTYEDTAARK